MTQETFKKANDISYELGDLAHSLGQLKVLTTKLKESEDGQKIGDLIRSMAGEVFAFNRAKNVDNHALINLIDACMADIEIQINELHDQFEKL